MRNWFLGQMDYIYFIYGLAFILLGVAAYILSKDVRQRLPWIWLALFGFSHGVHEWLDLLTLVWQEALWIKACRWTLLAASFLFLAEFGRLALVRQRNGGIGRWILGVLALFGCLGALSGWNGLGATTRYTLGLTGSLAAALALCGEGRRSDSPGRFWLTAGGTGFLLYALTLLVVPRAAFFPASLLNSQTFLNFTGFPVALPRTFLAMAITTMSLGYLRATWTEEYPETRRFRTRYLYGIGSALLVILTAGWILTQSLGGIALMRIQQETASRSKLIIQRLIFELEAAEAAAKAMSGSPWIGPAFWAKSPQAITQANSVLDRYQMRFSASPAYLLDRTGTVIASSNRDASDSFVGNNYAFRPYFQQAMKGLEGRYFALGQISKKRGFYAASPVTDPEGKIVGVAAIKQTLSLFQQGLKESDPAFLIDPEGVIFLSSRPNLEKHSLWPMRPLDKVEQAQFGTDAVIPVFPQGQTDGAEVKSGGKTYLFYRQHIEAAVTPGWSLVLLTPNKRVVFYRLLGIASAFIFVVFTLLAAGSNLSIREGANHIVASEARFRAMFDAAPEAVFVIDPETRKIVDANPFMVQWLGYSAEELLDLEIDQLLAPEFSGIQCGGDPNPTQGHRFRQKNGSLVDVECTSAEISYGGQVRKLAFVRDITERKQAEEDLHTSLRFQEIGHRQTELKPLLEAFVSEIKAYTNCEAAGIRVLDDDGGIPYLAYQGFRQQFYERESPLSIKSDRCMCINVITGDINPELPFYTKGGSFFMNGTTRFLATVPEEDKGETRNVCNQEGYESVALIPFRRGEQILGLIHLADRRENMAPLHVVEMLEKAGMQLGSAFLKIKAEIALKRSEQHYRSLFDNMLNGFAYCRMIFEDNQPQDFIYLKVNGAFEGLTGLKNVTGKRVSEVIPGIKESDPEIFELYGRVALTGNPEHCENYVEALGMWFSIAVYSPRKEYFVAIFDVITERKQAEAALRESEARFRGLFNSMTEGVALHGLIYDEHGEAIDYRIISTNPAFEKHTGLKPDQVIGLAASQAYSTGTAPFLETYAQVARSGQSCFFETFVPKMGRYLRISATSPKPGQFVTVFEDITAHTLMAEKLRDNEQFLTDIFNYIQDGLSVLDPDLNIMRVNPAMEKFGYPQPMVGKKCYEVYQDQNSPCENCPAQETLLTGKACRRLVKGHPSNSAEQIIEILTYPLNDQASGRVKAVIEFVRDVTEHKQAEEERLRFSKLESVATLAGGIAHDFNNILTGIMGNISLAMLDYQEKGPSRERLNAAERACLQAQNMARQLLTFAKGGAPIKELVSLEKLIAESASFSCSGSQVRCELNFPDHLWGAEADPGQIRQVFQNLVINAIQAMPSGGTIKIRGENLLVGKASDLPLDAGRYVKISIRDQGTGIPADFLSKIFDPYFTTKQTGSGLGLATVYSIVKKHQGHISVESRMGMGTTFHIIFPAVDREVSRLIKEDREVVTGRGKILVMDDEAIVRDLLQKTLSRLGYQAILARDGEEAIDLFIKAKESGEKIDALILDLTVPGGMGGKATIEKLLEIDPQVKALVSSGYSEDPIMAEYRKYGFSGVIAKPYRVAELSKVLVKLLAAGPDQAPA